MPKEFKEKKFRRPEKKEKFVNEQQCNFNPHLDEEQKLAFDTIMDNDITILTGIAGTGKSFVACAAAMKLFLDGDINKIVVARPMPKDQIGHLPGELNLKLIPLFIPTFENLYRISDKPKIEYMLNHEQIEMLPLQHVRGRTIDHAVLILEEAQNNTLHEFKTILSRIGEGSKIICTGDCDQIDLCNPAQSGLSKISKFKIPNYAVIELFNEHRKPIVIDVLKEFKKIGA